MTQDNPKVVQKISRRMLMNQLPVSGFMVLGSAAIPSRALASQSCGDPLEFGKIGQTVFPQPAGNAKRRIDTDCLPNHAVGAYASAAASPQATPMQLYIPAMPKAEDSPTPVADFIFGVAINGVPFESIGPAYMNDSQWRYNLLAPGVRPSLGLDANTGHVHSNGQYHYVGSPLGLICGLLDQRQRTPGEPVPLLLIGWAADGFPIYADTAFGPLVDEGTPLAHTLFRSSYRLKSGRRPSTGPGGVYDGTFVQDYEFAQGSGDLDACNGRFGATPEYPGGTYYYVVTRHFPFVPILFRGKPDSSFTSRSGPVSLPEQLNGYTGKSFGENDPVPENPASDAALLGLPRGMTSAQQPLVMDSDGYRYFLAIGSQDGKLYCSSVSIEDGELASPWTRVPGQLDFATLRPDLEMLEGDRFRVSIQSDLTHLRVSANGSLVKGSMHFDAWRPAL